MLKSSCFLIFIFWTVFISAQINDDESYGLKSNYTFIDENGKVISKLDFLKKRETNYVLNIVDDSLKQNRLIEREEKGFLKNKNILLRKIEVLINDRIDTTQSVVLVYYPGKDPCNSSGTATAKSEETFDRQLEKRISKFTKNKIIHIYKNEEGLKREKTIWYKDPENFFEKQFFKYYYPCGSFVVISGNGIFVSYFGEYSTNHIFNVVKFLYKK